MRKLIGAHCELPMLTNEITVIMSKENYLYNSKCIT